VDPIEAGPLDPSAPLTLGGTPPGVLHARLWTFVSGVSDGRPGWRHPTDRLRAHLEGEHDAWITSTNWTRAYDDHAYPRAGSPPPPFDVGEPDVLAAFDRTATEVATRRAIDESGDLIRITPQQIEDCINAADVWDLIDRIPSGPRLQDIRPDESAKHFGPGSPVGELVRTLIDAGVSERAAWHLCARVRPHLVPVPDRFVEHHLGVPPHEHALPLWTWALHHDRRLVEALENIRAPHAKRLSILRVAEILVIQRETDLRLALESRNTLFPFEQMPADGWGF
jgi:hypothetical protein